MRCPTRLPQIPTTLSPSVNSTPLAARAQRLSAKRYAISKSQLARFCRAQPIERSKTAKYAQFPKPQEAPELGENGQSMAGGTAAQAAWLQKRVTQMPKGANTILITHLPNLTGAFPQFAQGVADGEALIFAANTALVARIKIEDWEKLVK